jgi:mannitol 2-dehydrogenase
VVIRGHIGSCASLLDLRGRCSTTGQTLALFIETGPGSAGESASRFSGEQRGLPDRGRLVDASPDTAFLSCAPIRRAPPPQEDAAMPETPFFDETDRPSAAAPAAQSLDNELLAHPPQVVSVPGYDRASLTPGVVHIGVGGFHRAHQGIYFHHLAEQGVTDWGIIGVGLRSRRMQDALAPQDLLYSVVERGAEADDVSVVGVMLDYLSAPEDPEAVLCALRDPRVRLVTITVTGEAYHVDAGTGCFREDDEDVRADAAHPDRPVTVPGYLVESLRRRRADGSEITRTAVVGLARLRDAALADWIDEFVSFPSSVVDRITPASSDEVSDYVEQAFGIRDNSPVPTEVFRQWIIEDDFCNERPPLERVGVQFVPDTSPYALMKKRMLNGGHCALGFLGSLAGLQTTADVMADDVLHAYMDDLMKCEVMPLLLPVPDVDLAQYKRTLLERLENPKMGDQLSRLCRRGSSKVGSYLVPSIREAIDGERPHALLTLALAAWLRYLRGVDADGHELQIEDVRRDELAPLIGSDTDPRRILAQESIFGKLGEDEAFAGRLEQALRELDEYGPRGAAERTIQAAGIDG